MKLKYHRENFNPTQLDPLNIDRLAVESIPQGSNVLEIGCADGFMGEYLIKSKDCAVIGIEKRKEEVKIAQQRLTRVILGDIEDKEKLESILKEIKDKKFDVILATSIIEHLVNPSRFIDIAKNFLKKEGIVIVSVPNIVHWSMRLSLLRGQFDYSEYGILDQTHLHFFTLKSIKSYFENNGFKIIKIKIDFVGGGYPKISRFLGIFFPKLFAYQILVIAKKI